jgi:sulfatase maturation enzyme AslB (radical SAM superfamily)
MATLTRQARPVAIRPLKAIVVEPTNRCNLACITCPVNRGMQRPRGNMTFELFQKVIKGVPPLKRLSLNGWGEPLLHPDVFRMVRFAKENGAQTVIFCTNGTLLDDDRIDQVFDSGLDILEFSVDGLAGVYENIRGVDYRAVEQRIHETLLRRQELCSPLRVGLVFTVCGQNEAHAHAFQKAWQDHVDYIKLQPMVICGERTTPYCAEFFGKHDGRLVVLWDGTGTVCCADMEGEIALGSAWHESLLEIWNGDALQRIRADIMRGTLPPPCRGCAEIDTAAGQKRYS